MKKLVVLCFLSFSFFGFAQNEIEEIQNVIDQEVWKPFQKAFETLDGAALNATYAENVLRVNPSGIDTKNSFKAKNLERFKKNRKDGLSITLDFWFDSRHTNKTTSYEVGFYRIGFKDRNNKTSYSYGQFHIVIQRLEGHWKITQDWDTAQINGKIISKVDFIKKAPLNF